MKTGATSDFEGLSLADLSGDGRARHDRRSREASSSLGVDGVCTATSASSFSADADVPSAKATRRTSPFAIRRLSRLETASMESLPQPSGGVCSQSCLPEHQPSSSSLGETSASPQTPPPPIAVSTPSTPCNRRPASGAPPPLTVQRTTPLLRALSEDSFDNVRAALREDPEALGNFFFDCAFEPALCFSVRIGNSPKIVSLLLRHQADVTATDLHGRTALTAVCGVVRPRMDDDVLAPDGIVTAFDRRCFTLVRLLVDAGANLASLDAQGRSLVQVARGAGNLRLSQYIEFFHEARACAVLRRGVLARQHRACTLSLMTLDVVETICAFLCPY